MPTISAFFGLVVYMYFFDDERHHLPHIHVKYQGQEASFSIRDGALIRGELPQAKSRLVQAWIEIRREELMADWELASNGQTPFPIDPLR
ncbi:MAG: DUF4160 domain-containing protein [Betaproteobacteria bacterium]|nr:DUF4160 domain-containing protein [Betaproteobacteria bacterium]